ncbi:MAG: hypothetical protein ACOYT4_04605 [Nanoarchaeota archaeon]
MEQSNLEKDVLDIVRKWNSKYSAVYENGLSSKPRETDTIYQLERQVIGNDYVLTSWISGILRTEFGYSSNEIGKLGALVEGLVKSNTIEQKITGPLNPNITAFDSPNWKSYHSGRRGIKII